MLPPALPRFTKRSGGGNGVAVGVGVGLGTGVAGGDTVIVALPVSLVVFTSPGVVTVAVLMTVGTALAVSVPERIIGASAVPEGIGKVPVYVAVSVAGLLVELMLTFQPVPEPIKLLKPAGIVSETEMVFEPDDCTGPAFAPLLTFRLYVTL